VTHTPRAVMLVSVIAIAGVASCRPASPGASAAPLQAAPSAPPATAASPAGTATGSVAEALNSGGYTYVRLLTGKEEIWIAATEFAPKPGERLTVSLDMPMRNYHSTTLNRDFPLVYFVAEVAREGQSLASPQDATAAPSTTAAHQSAPGTPAPPAERIAPAPGGLSIAEIWAKRTSLAGKEVVVRGKVVKVNNGIMDRNWVHLQDGSGSAADRTDDLTVTTALSLKVGDVVTMAGVLAVAKDFGAGYAYDAILEKATVK
jgi:hypothetical protein